MRPPTRIKVHLTKGIVKVSLTRLEIADAARKLGAANIPVPIPGVIDWGGETPRSASFR